MKKIEKIVEKMLSILGYGKTFLGMISKQENHREDWSGLRNKNVKCMGEKPSTERQINYKKSIYIIEDSSH